MDAETLEQYLISETQHVLSVEVLHIAGNIARYNSDIVALSETRLSGDGSLH